MTRSPQKKPSPRESICTCGDDCLCTPENHCGCLDEDPNDYNEYADINLQCSSIHCENLICSNNCGDLDENICNCGCGCDSNHSYNKSVLVREFAPDFVAPAIMEDGRLEDNFNLLSYLDGYYGLIFFYPNDFTFVCPSEILAHNNRLEEFKKRNVRIIGISVDSVYAHDAWKRMPVDKGGIGDIKFPLISDITKEISQDYGVLNEEGVALRASFLIDEFGIIRHQLVNDLPLGRDVDESLRIIDALQFYEKNGNVCPAGWHQGDETMRPTQEGVSDYLKKHSHKL